MLLANTATLRARVSTAVVFRVSIAIFATSLLAAVLVALSAGSALAASSYVYEEAARFGGFDTSAYDGGHYGGTLTPGKFVDPTGFAVDTHDSSATEDTALYVVDRTSGLEGTKTGWRLQKLGVKGEVLGSTTFQLPNETGEQAGIAGLAVDDSGGEGRVYALVVGDDGLFTGFSYAQEIVAWSTTPSSNKLVAPRGLTPDPLGSTGGLVSSKADLASGLASEHALYDPQGIALDAASGGHNLAIEASDDTGTGASGTTSIPGVAGVWQVATTAQSGHQAGEIVGSWSARTLPSSTDEDEAAPYGISTNPDGSLNVLLAEDSGAAVSSDIAAVKLNANLGDPQILLDHSDQPPDQDRAAVLLSEAPGPYSGDYVAQAPGRARGLCSSQTACTPVM